MFVLKCKVSSSKQPRIVQSPAAAAAAASVSAAYALASAAETSKSENFVDPAIEIDQMIESITAEKKVIETKLLDLRAENLQLKGHLEETGNLHSELSTVKMCSF